MKVIKLFCLIYILLLSEIYLIFASDFALRPSQQLTIEPYKGDLVNFKGIVEASDENYCDIECQYSTDTSSGYVSDSGNAPATALSYSDKQEFPFTLRAGGVSNSEIQQLYVTCERIPNYINCWPESITHSIEIRFSFLSPEDGICTESREKCKSYLNFIGTSDCYCHSETECRPDGNRNPDGSGCQTFCGNKIYEPEYEDCSCLSDFTCPITKKCKLDNGRALDRDGCTGFCGNKICEKEYENCNNCSQDCKSCDLVSCTKDSECEGGYCVWNVCWNAPIRINDAHCDFGENCINSPNDCACEFNQRCNANGNCETYCGNGICEEIEAGVCKADCKWCGDRICQSSESCSSCSMDCGNCKTAEKEIPQNNEAIKPYEYTANNASVIENLTNPNKKKDNETTIKNKNPPKEPSIENNNGRKNIISILIVILLIIFIVAGGFLFFKRKTKNNTDLVICRKCKRKIETGSNFCLNCGNKLR